MEKWHGKVALVTGASKGIGRVLAKTLSMNKMKVIACARSLDKLQSLQQEVSQESNGAANIDARQCDYGNMDDVVSLFQYIAESYGTLHVCINNAGGAFPDFFLAKTWPENVRDYYSKCALERMKMYKDWQSSLMVNVLGVGISSKEAVNLMVRSGVKDGVIVNIDSMLGKFAFLCPMREDEKAVHYMHMYTATKWAVNALSQLLRLELSEKHPGAAGIRVVNICPAWIKTHFTDQLLSTSQQTDGSNKKDGGDDTQKAVENFFSKVAYLKPEDVVEAVMSALTCNSNVQLDDIVLQALKTP